MEKIKAILIVVCLLLLSACDADNPATPDRMTPAAGILLTATPQVINVTPSQTLAEKISTPLEMPASPSETPVVSAEAPVRQKNVLQVINSEGSVNVHSGPGLYYPVVSKLNNNDQIAATGIDQSGQWVQYKSSDSSVGLAWIFMPYTNYDRNTDSLPVVRQVPTPPITPTPVPPRAMGKITIVYPDGPVNVRSGPGTNYVLLGKVNNNDVLNATGTIDSGDWVQVQYPNSPDGTGWINSDYTNFDRNSKTLPLILDLPPTPAP